MSKPILGSGRYSIRTYKKAVRSGAAVQSSRGKKVRNRKFFRDDLREWVDSKKALNNDKGTVTDPRCLVPYRGQSYGTIVEALLARLPAVAKKLVGTFSSDFSSITSWAGAPRDKANDAILVSGWVWASHLFKDACRINPQLLGRLRRRKSTRPGVKRHVRSPLEKFTQNVNTLQRTGGVTPYAFPLMRCQYAIDNQWAVNRKGKLEQLFRIAIDRAVPQCGSKVEARKAMKVPA